MSKLKNDFPEKVRQLFNLWGYCYSFESGRNDADCLHHILGRVSNSPYNACPLHNWREHMPEWRQTMWLIDIHDFSVRSKYLRAVKEFLDMQWYEPNEEDIKFLEENKKYYEEPKTKTEKEAEEQTGSLPAFSV